MDAPPTSDARLRVVTEMWSTYRERGVEAALGLLHPRVEFVDRLGRAFHGHDGVRSFFAGFREQGEHFSAFPYSFEAQGGELLVVGYRHASGGDGDAGEALYFAHRVQDALIVRASAHRSRTEALAGIAARDAASERTHAAG